jgi:NAD(P)H-hydrate epimerase
MRAVTRDRIRAIDQRVIHEYDLPGLVLMENAGRAVADAVDARAPHGSVLVVAGPGNNGGDGLVAARHLHNRGYDVRVVLFAEPKPGSDPDVFLRVVRRILPVETGDIRRVLSEAVPGAIIDALLGTGLSRPVSGDLAEWIRAMNARDRSRTLLVAVDIPSGLDADTGKPLGVAVEADITVTMALPKVGFQQPGADRYTGHVVVADIGMPREALE